jgi:hypothetical protein
MRSVPGEDECQLLSLVDREICFVAHLDGLSSMGESRTGAFGPAMAVRPRSVRRTHGAS